MLTESPEKFNYFGVADVFSELSRVAPAHSGLLYDELGGEGVSGPRTMETYCTMTNSRRPKVSLRSAWRNHPYPRVRGQILVSDGKVYERIPQQHVLE